MRQMFVNLPVKNLELSMAFYKALGFSFNAQFTNETAACMIVEQNIFVMLVTEPFFKSFTPRALCDATKNTEVLVCISCASRAQVDEMAANAVKAGGTIPREPQDHGFMYSQAFADVDGHIWEPMWMDAAAVEQG
jgi:uncharacterized protein